MKTSFIHGLTVPTSLLRLRGTVKPSLPPLLEVDQQWKGEGAESRLFLEEAVGWKHPLTTGLGAAWPPSVSD